MLDGVQRGSCKSEWFPWARGCDQREMLPILGPERRNPSGRSIRTLAIQYRLVSMFESHSLSTRTFLAFGLALCVVVIGGCSSSNRATRPNDGTTPRNQTAESGQNVEGNIALQGQWRMVLDAEAALERIRDVAEEWYGVPYKWGGESKQGVDCSAFVQAVYEEAFHWLLPRVTERQVRAGRKIPPSKLRPGDLVFFQPGNNSNHVGVYLSDKTFVHASSSDGVTRSSLEDDYWTRNYWVSRRLMNPSKVPDTLSSQLIAYEKVDDPSEGRRSWIVDDPIVDADSSQLLAEGPTPEPSPSSDLDSLVTSDDDTERKGW